MNTYIQNKLDEFDKKFDRELFKQDEGYFHNREGYKLKHQLLKFIEQSLTDYHNHIVEKFKEKYKFSSSTTLFEILSILQDTNPKE